MAETKVILIDWDSCLNRFEDAVCRSLNERFGTTYARRNWTTWDWPREGIPSEQRDYLWRELFRSREWNLGIPRAPGSVLAVNRLLSEGWDVHVVTSRHKYMQPWLKTWLKLNHFDPSVRAVANSRKGDYARQQGVLRWIDDSPGQILSLRRVAPGYVIDHPWNRDPHWTMSDPGYGVIRTASVWTAVEDLMGGEEETIPD